MSLTTSVTQQFKQGIKLKLGTGLFFLSLCCFSWVVLDTISIKKSKLSALSLRKIKKIAKGSYYLVERLWYWVMITLLFCHINVISWNTY